MTKITDLQNELNKANLRNAELEAKVRKMEENDHGNIASDMVILSDMAYRSLNSKALAQASSMEAPTGDEPSIRPHQAYLKAFESILDGLHEALDGYTNKSFRRYGLRDNAEFYKGKLAVIAADNDGKIFLEGGHPVSEDAQGVYDRWIETTTLIGKVEELADQLEQAYDNANTGDDEGYKPKQQRIAEATKRKAAKAKSVAEIGAKLDDLLADAPKMQIKRA